MGAGDVARMGAAQQGPLSCPPQLWPRPGLVQSCSHFNCTCCPHPVLSSGQAGGCAAPPCTLRPMGTPGLEERPRGHAAGVLVVGISEVLGILQRAPLCLASCPSRGSTSPLPPCWARPRQTASVRSKGQGETLPAQQQHRCQMQIDSQVTHPNNGVQLILLQWH